RPCRAHRTLAVPIRLRAQPPCRGPHQRGTPCMWLTNCQLVEVETGSVRPSAAVEIQGDRITSVRTSAPEWPEAMAETYDLGGRFLMPGLISCHTHLSVVYPFDATNEQESAGLSTIRAAARASDALLAGITTIRCVH